MHTDFKSVWGFILSLGNSVFIRNEIIIRVNPC